MKKILNTILNVVGWLVVWVAFGSLGFATENPVTGFILFMGVFLAAFIGVYLYVRFHQRKAEPNKKLLALIYRLIGAVLCLMAVIIPLRMLPTIIGESITMTFLTGTIVVIGIAVLVAIGVLAVNIINNAKGKNLLPTLLGYLILIVISAIPALVISKYSGSYDTLGRTYWTALSIAILSWWGLSLVTTKEA